MTVGGGAPSGPLALKRVKWSLTLISTSWCVLLLLWWWWCGGRGVRDGGTGWQVRQVRRGKGGPSQLAAGRRGL